MMETFWYCAVTLMLAVYAVLDGFDFGLGSVYPFVARTEADRRTALAAIGPIWNGNEVWLIAAGGLLFLPFRKPMRQRLAASTWPSSSCCGC